MIEEKLAIGEKVTNRTLEGALSEKGKVVEQAKSVEQLQVEKSTLEATKEIEDLMKELTRRKRQRSSLKWRSRRCQAVTEVCRKSWSR